MDVKLTQPAEIALRTLNQEDRRRVAAWLDHLKNWENDSFVRENTRPLATNGAEKVYILRTSMDLFIFFTIDDREIQVLDMAHHDTLEAFQQATR